MKRWNLWIAAGLIMGSLWLSVFVADRRSAPIRSRRAFATVQADGLARSQTPKPVLACGHHAPTPAPPLGGEQRSEEQSVFVTVEVEGEALEIGLGEGR